MKPSDVLVKPIVTEKSAVVAAAGTYVFEVDKAAAKRDIQAAVEALFGVSVKQVRTLIVRGKAKRFGRLVGRKSNWKKAYVTLHDGHVLNLY